MQMERIARTETPASSIVKDARHPSQFVVRYTRLDWVELGGRAAFAMVNENEGGAPYVIEARAFEASIDDRAYRRG